MLENILLICVTTFFLGTIFYIIYTIEDEPCKKT